MRGHVAKREGKRGTSWYYWFDVGKDPATGKRKQISRGGHRTMKEARAALNTAISEVQSGTFAKPTNLTVEGYLRDWLSNRQGLVRPTTLSHYRRNAEAHVVPYIGAVPLDALTALDLDRLYTKLRTSGRVDGKGRLSEKSVRHVHTILHAALKDAVRKKVLRFNVADDADRPRPETPEMKVWAGEQVHQFIDSIETDRLRAAWLLLATTGMRRGEVLGLRWQDVDIEAARVTIVQAVTVADYEVIVSKPKTAAGTRAISLDPLTVDALRKHRISQLEERLGWGPAYNETDLVFTRGDGSMIHPQRFSAWFKQRAAKAGLPPIRLHDIRHSYATSLIRAGVPVKVVSQRIGHASPAITMATYQHVLPGDDEDAAVVGARAIFGPNSPTEPSIRAAG